MAGSSEEVALSCFKTHAARDDIQSFLDENPNFSVVPTESRSHRVVLISGKLVMADVLVRLDLYLDSHFPKTAPEIRIRPQEDGVYLKKCPWYTLLNNSEAHVQMTQSLKWSKTSCLPGIVDRIKLLAENDSPFERETCSRVNSVVFHFQKGVKNCYSQIGQLLSSEGDFSIGTKARDKVFLTVTARVLSGDHIPLRVRYFLSDAFPLDKPNCEIVCDDQKFDIKADKKLVSKSQPGICTFKHVWSTECNLLLLHSQVLEFINSPNFKLVETKESERIRRKSIAYRTTPVRQLEGQLSCVICSRGFDKNKVRIFSCACEVCDFCILGHLEVTIMCHALENIRCQSCHLPDVSNQTNLINNLLIIYEDLKETLSTGTYMSLLERGIQRLTALSPNFRWCPECETFGFIEKAREPLVCPKCLTELCRECNMKTHGDSSCEVSRSDISRLPTDIMNFLESSSNKCPRCKFPDPCELQDCMACGLCKFEFCKFCRKHTQNSSGPSSSTAVHGTHPRHCYFFLKNFKIERLWELLESENIGYKSDCGEDCGEDSLCFVATERWKCNNKPGYCTAGACEAHYIEYLVRLITLSKIDPVKIFHIDESVDEIRRNGLKVPPREDSQTQMQYKYNLHRFIEANIPLKCERETMRRADGPPPYSYQTLK